MQKAMFLVFADEPMSARNECKIVFGEKFPNEPRTLGNIYKTTFKESIGLARKLNAKVREKRRQHIAEVGVNLPHVGNKD